MFESSVLKRLTSAQKPAGIHSGGKLEMVCVAEDGNFDNEIFTTEKNNKEAMSKAYLVSVQSVSRDVHFVSTNEKVNLLVK